MIQINTTTTNDIIIIIIIIVIIIIIIIILQALGPVPRLVAAAHAAANAGAD